MKRYTLLFTVLLCFSLNAQTTLKDSVNVLYKNYFDLLKTKEDIDSISSKVSSLEGEYANFQEVLQSSNERIKTLVDDDILSLNNQLKVKRQRIINTTEFVFSANVSLNAIKQLDATSDYLSQVISLNNPSNSALGFSLSDEVEEILNEKIIKGNNKVNGVGKSKLLNFVDNIINDPITKDISNAIPVVGSIKSVVSLVMGTALRGDDVYIADIVNLKKSLEAYLNHYQGLADAQVNFEQKLGSLDVRKEALVLILTQYTVERISTLDPSEMPKIEEGITLTNVINKHYDKSSVQQKVDRILNNESNTIKKHLSDKRLEYPAYAINQAKFIRDEIEALSKEYTSIYNSYQVALTEVLRNSKPIGDPLKIESIVNDLNGKLVKVKSTFNDSVNIDMLTKKFTQLSKS